MYSIINLSQWGISLISWHPSGWFYWLVIPPIGHDGSLFPLADRGIPNVYKSSVKKKNVYLLYWLNHFPMFKDNPMINFIVWLVLNIYIYTYNYIPTLPILMIYIYMYIYIYICIHTYIHILYYTIMYSYRRTTHNVRWLYIRIPDNQGLLENPPFGPFPSIFPAINWHPFWLENCWEIKFSLLDNQD